MKENPDQFIGSLESGEGHILKVGSEYVRLHADIQTIRSVGWNKKDVVILGDLKSLDGSKPLETQPRNLDLTSSLQVGAELDFQLFEMKDGKQEIYGKGENWISSSDRILSTIRDQLRATGIDVEGIRALEGESKFGISIRMQSDLKALADQLVLARFGIREIASMDAYEVSFMPKDQQGNLNNLSFIVRPQDLSETFTEDLLKSAKENKDYLSPHINSVKNLKEKEKTWVETFKAGESKEFVKVNVTAADINPYVAFKALFADDTTFSQEFQEHHKKYWEDVHSDNKESVSKWEMDKFY